MKTNPYADPHHEKHEAYNAAATLLAKEGDASLRYAALELRRCIEAIVYEKLKFYGELLPEKSVHTWQAAQAFDALIKIEPNAEENVTYGIASQTEPDKLPEGPFREIGTDRRPKGKRVEEIWHSLGSYLHAQWPFSKKQAKGPSRASLENVLKELEPLVNNSFSMFTSDSIDFKCLGCEAMVKVMERAVELGGMAFCLTCGMPYRAEKVGDGFTFIPGRPPFTCECGAATFVPPKQIKEGYKFACRGCKRNFQVVGFDWTYMALEEGAGDSAEV
jgi:hypothetical protein